MTIQLGIDTKLFNQTVADMVDEGYEFLVGGFYDEDSDDSVHFIKAVKLMATDEGDKYICYQHVRYYPKLEQMDTTFSTLWFDELVSMLKLMTKANVPTE